MDLNSSLSSKDIFTLSKETYRNETLKKDNDNLTFKKN